MNLLSPSCVDMSNNNNNNIYQSLKFSSECFYCDSTVFFFFCKVYCLYGFPLSIDFPHDTHFLNHLWRCLWHLWNTTCCRLQRRTHLFLHIREDRIRKNGWLPIDEPILILQISHLKTNQKDCSTQSMFTIVSNYKNTWGKEKFIGYLVGGQLIS